MINFSNVPKDAASLGTTVGGGFYPSPIYNTLIMGELRMKTRLEELLIEKLASEILDRYFGISQARVGRPPNKIRKTLKKKVGRPVGKRKKGKVGRPATKKGPGRPSTKKQIKPVEA
jgi:hypothetical protein